MDPKPPVVVMMVAAAAAMVMTVAAAMVTMVTTAAAMVTMVAAAPVMMVAAAAAMVVAAPVRTVDGDVNSFHSRRHRGNGCAEDRALHGMLSHQRPEWLLEVVLLMIGHGSTTSVHGGSTTTFYGLYGRVRCRMSFSRGLDRFSRGLDRFSRGLVRLEPQLLIDLGDFLQVLLDRGVLETQLFIELGDLLQIILLLRSLETMVVL